MTPTADDALDQLLTAWAVTQRLDHDEAERIRTAITRQPDGLAPAWWRDFSTQIGTTIAHAIALSAPPHVPQPSPV